MSLPNVCEFALALLKHPVVRARFDPVDPVYVEAVANGVGSLDGDRAGFVTICDFLRAYGHRKSVMAYLKGAKTVGALCLLFALRIDSGEEMQIPVDARGAGEDALGALGVVVTGMDVPVWARQVIAEAVEEAPVRWSSAPATRFCSAAVRAMAIEEAIAVIERLKTKRDIAKRDWQLISEMVLAFPAERERIVAAVGITRRPLAAVQGAVANWLDVVFGPDLD
jgi:hypothetical protein